MQDSTPGTTRAVTLESLAALCEELGTLQDQPDVRSRTLIALNQLYGDVVNYLECRGLSHDKEGYWLRRHWSYSLLQQLADRIETCKARGVDEPLLQFVAKQLLPRLAAERAASM